MIVSFDRLPEQLVPGFKGGDGVVSVRAYDDDMGRILQLTVPVGGSIGPHTHTDNCEVMCIVSGTGLCHDDGTEVTLTPVCGTTVPKATATASATPAKSRW